MAAWPGEVAYQALCWALQDAETVQRYRSKVVTVPGSSCSWWSGAVSGRGHGRFWLAAVQGRDIVVIAHRFGYGLEHGPEALLSTRALGHRCDTPLCQRIGGHVEASSAWRNRQEWVMRRHTIGGPLRDVRGARGRARARCVTRCGPIRPAAAPSRSCAQGWGSTWPSCRCGPIRRRVRSSNRVGWPGGRV
jgi:hypothetical protein